MKLVLISDTHSQLNKVNIPDGDVLIHCGDATYHGDALEIAKFNVHLKELKPRFKNILFVPGNHDFDFQDRQLASCKLITNATVLIDSSWEIDGVKFYFSPWQPWFWDWAFNFPRYDNGAKAKETWAKIPDDTNVLITHGPPYGILDKLDEYGSEPGQHVGCPLLRRRIEKLSQLKLHAFGHIHCGYGQVVQDNITFINAATCTEEYKPTNPPIVFEL